MSEEIRKALGYQPWWSVLFAELAAGRSSAQAAETAGVTTQTYYNLRSTNPEFRRLADIARVQAAERVIEIVDELDKAILSRIPRLLQEADSLADPRKRAAVIQAATRLSANASKSANRQRDRVDLDQYERPASPYDRFD